MLTMKKLMMATTAIVISSGFAATADTTVQTDTDIGADAQVQTGNGATTETEGGASVSGETSTEANDDAMTQDTDAGAEVDAAMLDEEALMGASVYDAKDVRVGEISEVESDADGKIAGVVIDVGGFLGLGEKPVQIKFEDLTFEEKGNADAEGIAADVAGSAETALGMPGAEAESMLDYRIHVNMTKEEMGQLPEYQG